MMQKTTFVLFLAFAFSSSSVMASEPYVPVFKASFPQNPNSVTSAYMEAYRSSTVDMAIEKWQSFLREYASDDAISDLTDLALLRQAHFELMRLYYVTGQVKEADAMLLKTSHYELYSLPDAKRAKNWCMAEGYCER